MRATLLMFCALCAWVPTAACADEPERAAEAIEKAGATVRRDETAEEKPVVRVIWDSARAADKDLAHLKALPRLKFLRMECPRVTDAGLAHLGGVKSLRELRISGDHFTDEGAAHLRGMKDLESLHFHSDELTDAGLAKFAGLGGLRELVISSPKVTDAGLQHLVGLRKLRTLQLGLRSKVTGKGTAALRKELPDLVIKY